MNHFRGEADKDLSRVFIVKEVITVGAKASQARI